MKSTTTDSLWPSVQYFVLHATDELREATQTLLSAVQIPPEQKTHKMHAVVSAMHGLCQKIEFARDWLEDAEIREIIQPAWQLHSEAPFVERLQIWPRGYPGDFETIEMLMAARSTLDPAHPAYWIDWYALNTAIAYQHRNKLAFQRNRTLEGLREGASILNVGCGGAYDLKDTEMYRDKGISVTLVDIDADALELAQERVSWASEVTPLKADAVRALRSMKTKYDRIVFGGLFDYLDDRAIRLLLSMSYGRLLKDDGRILFTNLSNHTTYDVWLEFLASWQMKYRTEAGVANLAAMAEIPPEKLTVDYDATGLSLLCEISR